MVGLRRSAEARRAALTCWYAIAYEHVEGLRDDASRRVDGPSAEPGVAVRVGKPDDAGYTQGQGYSGIGCDDGAAEALGVDRDWISPAVYFATEAQANQAKAAFEARGQHVDGLAHVTTYCLD